MPKTLRERFLEKFPCEMYHLRDKELHDEYNNKPAKDYALVDFLAFIETIQEEALKEGEESMKQKCLRQFTNGHNGNAEEVYNSISSL